LNLNLKGNRQRRVITADVYYKDAICSVEPPTILMVKSNYQGDQYP
jgi:hypothetical protein